MKLVIGYFLLRTCDAYSVTFPQGSSQVVVRTGFENLIRCANFAKAVLFQHSSVLKSELHCHQWFFFQQKMFVLLIYLSIPVITQSSLATDNGVMRNLSLLLFDELLANPCNEM